MATGMKESAIRIWNATAHIPVEYCAYFRGKSVCANARRLRGDNNVALVWNAQAQQVELVAYGRVVWTDTRRSDLP